MIAVEADAAEQVTPNSARADLAVLDEVEARYAHWHPPLWSTLVAPVMFGLLQAALVLPSWRAVLVVGVIGLPVTILVNSRYGCPPGTRQRLAEQPTGPRLWLSRSWFAWIFVTSALVNLDVVGAARISLTVAVGLLAAVHLWFCLHWSRVDGDA